MKWALTDVRPRPHSPSLPSTMPRVACTRRKFVRKVWHPAAGVRVNACAFAHSPYNSASSLLRVRALAWARSGTSHQPQRWGRRSITRIRLVYMLLGVRANCVTHTTYILTHTRGPTPGTSPGFSDAQIYSRPYRALYSCTRPRLRAQTHSLYTIWYILYYSIVVYCSI